MLISSIIILTSVVVMFVSILLFRSENSFKIQSEKSIKDFLPVIFALIGGFLLFVGINYIPLEMANFLTPSSDIEELKKEYRRLLKKCEQDLPNLQNRFRKVEKVITDTKSSEDLVLLKKELSNLQKKINNLKKNKESLKALYDDKFDSFKKINKEYIYSNLVNIERNLRRDLLSTISNIDKILQVEKIKSFKIEGTSEHYEILPVILARRDINLEACACDILVAQNFKADYLKEMVHRMEKASKKETMLNHPPYFGEEFWKKIVKPVARIEIKKVLSDYPKELDLKDKIKKGWKISYEVNLVNRKGAITQKKDGTGFLINIRNQVYFLTAHHNFDDPFNFLISKMYFNDELQLIDPGHPSVRYLIKPEDGTHEIDEAMVLLSGKPENKIYQSKMLDYVLLKLLDVDKKTQEVTSKTKKYLDYRYLVPAEKPVNYEDNVIVVHHPNGISKCISYFNSKVVNTLLFTVEGKSKELFMSNDWVNIRKFFLSKGIPVYKNFHKNNRRNFRLIINEDEKEKKITKYSLIEKGDLLEVYFGDIENEIYYTADTDTGSSGAPVMNQDGDVVALHVGTVNAETSKFKKTWNIGIKIQKILNDLAMKKNN